MNAGKYLACLLFAFTFISCSKDHDMTSGQDGHMLTVNYHIDPSFDVYTKSNAGAVGERMIEKLYVLFFHASDHAANPGGYAGYSLTKPGSSGSLGTVSVNLPDGGDVSQAWQLVFLANPSKYAELGTYGTFGEWLAGEMTGVKFEDCSGKIIASANDAEGIKSPLLMSGSAQKSEGGNNISVNLRRNMARVDLKIAPTVIGFELVSAKLWNARTYTSIISGTELNESGFDGYSDYQIKGTPNMDSDSIGAQLYAFPNTPVASTADDDVTTCLIVGGKYGGSESVTYYRVNVAPFGGSQKIERNRRYVINIVNVKGEGERTESAAKGSVATGALIEYTMTDTWDDDFYGTYVFDQYGNGLSVSARSVTFSNSADQEIEINVFTKSGDTNPITGDWDADIENTEHFSAEIIEGSRVRVTALNANDSFTERHTMLNLVWGDLVLPVEIIQQGLAAGLAGLTVNPSSLRFPGSGMSKEFLVDLEGDFSGIDKNDIHFDVEGMSEWFSVADNTAKDNAGMGMFYYTVTTEDLPEGADERSGRIRFSVNSGQHLMVSTVSVYQSRSGSGSAAEETVEMWRWDEDTEGYVLAGGPESYYEGVEGMPDTQTGDRHLNFNVAVSSKIKYKIRLDTDMSWQLVKSGLASDNLIYSIVSSGDEQTIEISAKKDVKSGWSGRFYIEYVNGTKTEFSVHQQGVLGKSAQTGKTYYYGTMVINGRMWLDRNLGAVSNGFYTGRTLSDPAELGGLTNDAGARGEYFNSDAANTACPAGFRLPKGEGAVADITGNPDTASDYGELDWLATHAVWSGDNGDGQVGAKNVWYLTYSDEPLERWFIPLCGNANYPENGYLRGDNNWILAFIDKDNINALRGSVRWFKSSTHLRNEYQVRCIRDEN